jgi:hypothetical protein
MIDDSADAAGGAEMDLDDGTDTVADADGGADADTVADADGGTDADGAETPTDRPTPAEIASALDVPADATADETAAIVAVVGAHLRDQEAAAAAADDGGTESWNSSRWTFAGRMDALQGRTERVPNGAPRDEWTASSRSRRF